MERPIFACCAGYGGFGVRLSAERKAEAERGSFLPGFRAARSIRLHLPRSHIVNPINFDHMKFKRGMIR
jgi:hypothetical protein